MIIEVSPQIIDVLGWRPEELVGRPSTEFIHLEDQPSAIAAWFAMIDAPGESRAWQGRYRTPEGTWKWVECVNVNNLLDTIAPAVVTTMRAVTVDQVSLVEELRARKQLLSRLSDAMPIGMIEFNRDGEVTFTNDRLHGILGVPSSATLVAQLSNVHPDDRAGLDSAVDTVLDDRPVDDLELRFIYGGQPRRRSADTRVCVLSMRSLSDDAGAVTGAVGCITDVTEAVDLRHQLELRASTDALTACYNRSAIFDILGSARQMAHRHKLGYAVVFVDLCRFKAINDEFGHGVGDEVLRLVADRLREAVRHEDRVGRVGGDEFLVVCPEVASEAIATELAERIRVALSDTLTVGAGSLQLRASIGVAWTKDLVDGDMLVAEADRAMYEAKRDGSNRVSLIVG